MEKKSLNLTFKKAHTEVVFLKLTNMSIIDIFVVVVVVESCFVFKLQRLCTQGKVNLFFFLLNLFTGTS